MAPAKTWRRSALSEYLLVLHLKFQQQVVPLLLLLARDELRVHSFSFTFAPNFLQMFQIKTLLAARAAEGNSFCCSFFVFLFLF